MKYIKLIAYISAIAFVLLGMHDQATFALLCGIGIAVEELLK